ncbi:unnamed protein product [Sphenostylis stenocarpa]|uniref:Uncharacterized protein n=1 Tax=Sphenostylis stenocarpa TaxID=92480 RepID=A0AA86VY31_9FABA|nr:unnamed protein product [Sphenostylis stenocarpa]
MVGMGNIEKFGLKRPMEGPLLLKNTKSKAPVLDIGTLDSGRVELVNGSEKETVESENEGKASKESESGTSGTFELSKEIPKVSRNNLDSRVENIKNQRNQKNLV